MPFIVFVVMVCAKVAGEHVSINVVERLNSNMTTTTTINEDITNEISHGSTTGENETTGEIRGQLKPVKPSELDQRDNYIASYTVNAKDGYRFKAKPELTHGNVDYYYKSAVVNDDNGNKIGITFDIYKKR